MNKKITLWYPPSTRTLEVSPKIETAAVSHNSMFCDPQSPTKFEPHLLDHHLYWMGKYDGSTWNSTTLRRADLLTRWIIRPAKVNGRSMFIIDWEKPGNDPDWEGWYARLVPGLKKAIARIRGQLPTEAIGVYGWPGSSRYWAEKEWAVHLEIVKEITDLCDFVVPVCQLHPEHVTATVCETVVRQAKTLGKPVIPVISYCWLEPDGAPIDLDVNRLMLKRIAPFVDGVIIFNPFSWMLDTAQEMLSEDQRLNPAANFYEWSWKTPWWTRAARRRMAAWKESELVAMCEKELGQAPISLS